ncbi:hypothetical protein MRX96_047237 [Rhipicephalus microplus]
MNTRDTLLTYHDLTLHYCLSRLTFPPPHRSLSQHQQRLRRQLQARIFLTPCTSCPLPPRNILASLPLMGQLNHQFRANTLLLSGTFAPASWHLRSPQPWEAALSSSRPDLQLRLVTWAEDVVAGQCLDATTGSLKATHNAAF